MPSGSRLRGLGVRVGVASGNPFYSSGHPYQPAIASAPPRPRASDFRRVSSGAGHRKSGQQVIVDNRVDFGAR